MVDDELMGIPPGELVDETDELEMSGISNAGTAVPDGGADTGPDGGTKQSLTAAPKRSPTAAPKRSPTAAPHLKAPIRRQVGRLGLLSRPDRCRRWDQWIPARAPSEPVVWPLSGSVGGLPS